MSTAVTYDPSAVFATSMDFARKELALEIVQSNPLLTHLYRTGGVHYNPGAVVKLPVALASMTATAQARDVAGSASYFDSATYDELPQAAVYNRHTTTTGTVTPRGYYDIPFTVPHEDMDFNGSPAQVISLVNAKKQVAAATAANTIGSQLYVGDGDTEEIQGLDAILEWSTVATQADSSTLTVGSIAKASGTTVGTTPDYLWQNQYSQISTFAADGLLRMSQAFLAASASGSHPDIILMDPDAYLLLDQVMLPNQKERDREMFDLGFDNILFRGTPCIPDPNLSGTGKIYMLTTHGRRGVKAFSMKPEHFAAVGQNPLVKGNLSGVGGLSLYVDSSSDFALQGPMNLMVIGKPSDGYNLRWAGMWCASSLARQAVLDFAGGSAV